MLNVRVVAIFWFGLAAAAAAPSGFAQESPAPATAKLVPLSWKRTVHLHDGRTLVSDGVIALDMTLARPATPPAQDIGETGAKMIEGFLAADLPDEFAFSQLTRRGEVYAAPNGVTLNPVYVDYVRQTLPEPRVRFRTKTQAEPVIIVLDGRAAGLLMPMKSAK